jgi:ammonium transporter Rh
MSARALIIIGATLEVIVITLYGIFVRFDEFSRMEHQTDEQLQEALDIFLLRYPLLQDVHVMMFVGFGFLMTFLKHNSWTGVSINFIAAAVTIQVYILFEGFWHAVSEENWEDTININTEIFIRADYAAAAVLISFGAVIGKINTAQTVFMAVIETFIYALQEMLVFEKIKAVDAGGSISIHCYGAYFGLMVSLIFSPKTVIGNPYNDSSYNSNLFAMIGTIFLWMHWPSFNSGIVTDPAGMHRAVVNTILSLTGSCVSTFVISVVYNQGKFHMEDILNATLAGGVVIGSACDVIIYPFISLLCGVLAGILSTIGYKRITRFLEHNIGLFDTAGINNLHGMPGFLGGILSAIVIAGLGVTQWDVDAKDYGLDGYYKQGGLQVAATFTSLGFGLVGGAITGFLLKFIPLGRTEHLFQDKPYWIKCEPDPYEHLRVDNVTFNPNKKKNYALSDESSPSNSPVKRKTKKHIDSESDN